MSQAVAHDLSGRTEVVSRTEAGTVAPHPASDTTSLLQVITRAASDSSVDIDKMERLMQMHERLVARDAEQAFNTALNVAQSEMGRISADANNPQTRSKYATYGKLDSVLRPIYARHGFALSFDTGMDAPPDMVRVIARVTHSGGFTRSYHADMPADGKGAKGGDVMTKTHATGAAMSYGMRYLLKMIFNVAIGEEDRDGNTPVDTGEVISADQRDTILKLIDEVGGSADVFCKYFKIDAVAGLPASQFKRAVSALEAKRAK
jgi:hypothetical protein